MYVLEDLVGVASGGLAVSSLLELTPSWGLLLRPGRRSTLPLLLCFSCTIACSRVLRYSRRLVRLGLWLSKTTYLPSTCCSRVLRPDGDCRTSSSTDVPSSASASPHVSTTMTCLTTSLPSRARRLASCVV